MPILRKWGMKRRIAVEVIADIYREAFGHQALHYAIMAEFGLRPLDNFEYFGQHRYISGDVYYQKIEGNFVALAFQSPVPPNNFLYLIMDSMYNTQFWYPAASSPQPNFNEKTFQNMIEKS